MSLVILCSLLAFDSSAQTFTRVTNSGPISTDAFLSTGAAWIDINSDGWLDMFALGENENHFYVNNQDGTFSELTTGDFLTPVGVGNGGLSGDFDNDGLQDLFVPNFVTVPGGSELAPNVLYRNSGPPDYDLELVDLGPELNASPSASWVDYDQDGDLDLFSAGAAVSGNPTTDLFYRQDADTGFTNLDYPSFIESRFGNGTHDTWVDIDLDGDQDLFVVNWSRPNNLYKSLLVETGNPDRFEKLFTSGLTNEISVFDIGSSWGDYDNDGDFDVFLPVLNSSDRLYRNNGNGTFSQITNTPLTLGRSVVGVWGDVDNDGDLDMYTGSSSPRLYRNDGSGVFTSVPSSEVGHLLISPPALQAGNWGDYNNDGNLDLYLLTYAIPQNRNGTPQPNYLMRNDGGTSNHWITIRAVGTLSNTSGIGARISLKCTIGGVPGWQHRYVSGGTTSFVFHGDNRAHFGLGDATIADSITIAWPSGIEQVVESQVADQVLTITEKIPTGFLRPNFFADQTTASATTSLTVQFTDASLVDPNNPIVSWEWDFDSDGVVDDTVQDPMWTFSAEVDTTFSVSLTVSNGMSSQTLDREEYVSFEGITTGTEDVDEQVRQEFELRAPYPNPITQSATLHFIVSRSVDVTLTLHNLLGRRVKTLSDGIKTPGSHEVTIDARDLASGVYVVRLRAAGHVRSRTMAIVR